MSDLTHVPPPGAEALPPAFSDSGRFQPRGMLGRGSMGVVYRVYDAEMDVDVALKTLPAHDPEQLYRLKQEFRVLSGIIHPNLVQLYELVASDRECFFTMELIDGIGFTEYLRLDLADGDPLPEAALPRLIAAARQLVIGLAAVHAAGKLHRDVKPSNVLVSREGRVCLLDFGLATALGVDADGGMAGTLAYMAPEQIWGSAPQPAGDWYSVGVLLYEALIGRLPFDSSGARLLQDKQRAAPPSVRALAPHLPESIDSLIRTLLDPNPAQRPDHRAILDCLPSERRSGEVFVDDVLATSPEVPFVGRAAELARLQAVFDGVRKGEPALVRLYGPSGIGKTELVRRFVGALERDSEALVLRGRCHPQEAIPYKALDRLIDGLSRFLLSLPLAERGSLAPENAGALMRLFPVLERVPDWNAGEYNQVEPHELRRRGFGALRQLLDRLAQQQPLVLWIDDLQWTDLDSALALRELLRPPEAPAILLLFSYRGEEPPHIPWPDQDESGTAMLPAEAVHDIEVGPLADGDTRELARLLCAAQIESDRRIADIVAESAGSPFFVTELARFAPKRAPTVSFAEAMTGRVEQLTSTAREVLEVVSIAGGPLPRSVALRAAGVGERGRPVVSALENGCLVRTSGVKDEIGVEVYHDRIRETLVARLAPARRQAIHRQIADTLRQRPDVDPHALFTHYRGAGDTALAGHYAVAAADAAAQTLAFDRATQLYREAIELRDNEAERPALRAKLAEALANAGQALEAARTYEVSAEEWVAAGGTSEEIVPLRQRAATHYLQTGHIEQGIAATRAVLRSVGIPYPDTPGRALRAALRQRARLTWRGWGFELRSGAPAARQRQRLEAGWEAAVSLSLVDQVVADGLGVRHLIEALDAGDPVHAARALGSEAARTSQLGGGFLRRRRQRLLEMMRRLVDQGGGPYERAYFHVVSGMAAFQAARWRAAWEHFSTASEMLRQQCVGVTWEIVTTETFGLSALAHLGELARLARQLPAAIGDAKDRGDLYATIFLQTGVLNLAWLAQDRPELARERAEEGMAQWPATDAFHVQHYVQLIALVHVDLYCGDGRAAWQRIEAAWPKLRKFLFLSLEGPRVELRNLRARAALAAASAMETGEPGARATAARLRRVAEREAHRLARDTDVASSQPFHTLIKAGVARGEGRYEEAVNLLARAGEQFRACEMGLYEAACRWREGAWRGGEQGRQRHRTAEQWMASQGVRDPAAMVSVFVPSAS